MTDLARRSFRSLAATCLVSLVAAPAVFVLAGCNQAADPGPASSAVAEAPEPWFDAIAPRQVDEASGRDLLEYAAARLNEREPPTLSPAVRQDREACLVFLARGDGHGPAKAIVAGGSGLVSAINLAVERLKREGAEGAWIRLDVVTSAEPAKTEGIVPLLPSDVGLTGIAFGPNDVVYSPDELWTQEDLDVGGLWEFDHLRQPRDASNLASTSSNAPMYRFRTQAFFTDGEETVALYRGHRRFGPATADELLAASRAAGEYLTRATKPDGMFVYEIDPSIGVIPDTYNIVRHAGTTYAMLELYEVTRDADLLAAAERALAVLVAAIRPAPGHEDDAEGPMCLVWDDESKLGGNALAIVALAKHAQATGSKVHLSLLRRLNRWAIANQSDEGEFTAHKWTYPDGARTPFESTYYPGEALLGLVRTYQVDPDPKWLDAAALGADFLIHKRDQGLADDELPHDHWLLYALGELHQHRPDPARQKHGLRIVRSILAGQLADQAYEDWNGAFGESLRGNPVATRSEGLAAAWPLAATVEPKLADEMISAVQRAVAFQRQLQYEPSITMYFHDGRRVLGSFREGLTTPQVRIDTVQHNISALLGLRRVLLARAK